MRDGVENDMKYILSSSSGGRALRDFSAFLRRSDSTGVPLDSASDRADEMVPASDCPGSVSPINEVVGDGAQEESGSNGVKSLGWNMRTRS